MKLLYPHTDYDACTEKTDPVPATKNSLGRKTKLPIGNRTVSRELSPEMTKLRKTREISFNSD
jgi:hypothetical protein